MSKPDRLSLEELCELLDIELWDDWREANPDSYIAAYTYAYNESIKDGKSEEEAHEEAETAEGEAETEDYNRWENAIILTADKYFEHHGMRLTERMMKVPGDGQFSHYWRKTWVVTPIAGWDNVATHIRETINGVGYFHFNDNKEFRDSIPVRSDKQLALQHLHWMKRYGDVYGELSPESLMERHLR